MRSFPQLIQGYLRCVTVESCCDAISIGQLANISVSKIANQSHI